MSWATAVEGDVSVILGFIGLRADFGFVVDGLGLQALRAGRGSLVLNREDPLWIVPLMMVPIWSLNKTVFTVFFKPLWGESHREGSVMLLV